MSDSYPRRTSVALTALRMDRHAPFRHTQATQKDFGSLNIMVFIDRYPQLKLIAWNRPGDRMITEQDALALYERNWRFIEPAEMPAHERELLDILIKHHGGGVLHV